MKTMKILSAALLIGVAAMFTFIAFGQDSHCGTTNEKIDIPFIKKKHEMSKIIAPSRASQASYPQPNQGAKSAKKKMDHATCIHDNVLLTTVNAPTAIGDSTGHPCIFAGKYINVKNMQEGYLYVIYTCNTSNANFDTELSVYYYNQPGGYYVAEAFDDDFCGLHSAVFFQPDITGDYDVLVDKYHCVHDNSQCVSLWVKMIDEPWPVITIPTVVHVVYYNQSQFVSITNVQTQIDILNQDFQRQNPDFFQPPQIPSPFRGRSYNPAIEFCLVQRDPQGNPTNGITYTQTSVDFSSVSSPLCDNTFCLFNDSMGGKTEWNSCLNIYVSAIGGSILGFAFMPQQLPGYPPIMVIRYDAFGTMYPATSPNHKGRTATHETGHTFGLYHPFVTTGNTTCASDSVFDTPPEENPQSECPVFPTYDNCETFFPGVMFMNFMDYVDDLCMRMFTVGQAWRMDNTIFTYYQSILNNTDACIPLSSGISSYENNESDIYPNPGKGTFFMSLHERAELIITNIIGETVFCGKYEQGVHSIHLRHAASGLYFVNISGEKTKIFKKIILTH